LVPSWNPIVNANEPGARAARPKPCWPKILTRFKISVNLFSNFFPGVRLGSFYHGLTKRGHRYAPDG
jgi:hypothetical protein